MQGQLEHLSLVCRGERTWQRGFWQSFPAKEVQGRPFCRTTEWGGESLLNRQGLCSWKAPELAGFFFFLSLLGRIWDFIVPERSTIAAKGIVHTTDSDSVSLFWLSPDPSRTSEGASGLLPGKEASPALPQKVVTTLRI